MEDAIAAPNGSRLKRRWLMIAKFTLFAVLMYFVSLRAVALWQDSPPIKLHVDVRWLVPSAVLYMVGWLPSVWFWHALLTRMDKRPGWYATLRAYYVGHLGKYVPGKALVLVIRGGMLKESGGNPVLAGLAAVYETLVSMSSGIAIAVALAPAVIPDGLWERMPTAMQFLRQQPLLVPIVVFAAAIASTPFSAWLFTRIGRKAMPRATDAVPRTSVTHSGDRQDAYPTVTCATDAAPKTEITARLVLQGFLVTSLGWLFLALSLGCALQAISDEPLDLMQFPVWLASISLSTFSGFVVLIAPGGLGVREWVLIETLKDQPGIGGEKAIVVAGLVRVIWFAAEMAMAGLLYLIKPVVQSAK